MKGYSKLETKVEHTPVTNGIRWTDMPPDCMGEVIASCDERSIPLGAVIVHCHIGLVVLGDTIRSWTHEFDHKRNDRADVFVRLLNSGDVVRMVIKPRSGI